MTTVDHEQVFYALKVRGVEFTRKDGSLAAWEKERERLGCPVCPEGQLGAAQEAFEGMAQLICVECGYVQLHELAILLDVEKVQRAVDRITGRGGTAQD